MSHNTALLLSGFNGIAYFFSALVPIWVIDRYLNSFPNHETFKLTCNRLGRRKLMMFAVVGQGCCMAVLAGTVWNGGHAAGLVATVMLFLFNFFFGVGLLAIPWLCMWLTRFFLDPKHSLTDDSSARGVFAPCDSNSIRSSCHSNQLYDLQFHYPHHSSY